jgi:hypothetical protein
VTEAPPRRRRAVLLSACAVGLALLVGTTLARRQTRTIPLGARKQWDDFAFAVTDVHRVEAINGLRPERGTFLVVRFGIRNMAKRVDYQFHPERMGIEDAQGRTYSLAVEATRRRQALPEGQPGCDAPIPAGKSCTTDLIFDVPTDIALPRLFMSSGPLGDAMGWLFEGKVRFALEGEPR